MTSNTVEKVKATDLKEYKAFFKEIKERILTSQIKAALAVNHELINLYWEIGSKIHLPKDEGFFPNKHQIHGSICKGISRICN